MIIDIKTGDDVVHEAKADTPWKAVEAWLEHCHPDDLRNYESQGIVFSVFGREFKVAERMGDFYADPVDGQPWEQSKPDLSCHGVGEDTQNAETFHLGLSCYGPNKDGKFRGAISVDSVSLFSQEFDTLDDARAETTGKLLEFITRTLGFSRKDAIEEISREARHGRQANSDAGTTVDG